MARDEVTEEDKKIMDEWLSKGNKVTVCPAGERTDPDLISHVWKRGRPKAKATETPKAKPKKKN